MHERHRVRVAAAQLAELSAGAARLALRHEPVPQLDRLLLGLVGDRVSSTRNRMRCGARYVRPSNDADLGVLAPAGGEEPDPLAGRTVGEARASGLPAPRDQLPLPVQLLVTLEPVERLEHAEVGARDHRCGV